MMVVGPVTIDFIQSTAMLIYLLCLLYAFYLFSYI
jgi:hypothetical protein